MSTLKTKNIQHPSASSPALVLNVDGTFNADVDSLNAQSLHGSSFGFRNKLINGDFSQWQRGSNFSTSGFTADRWKSSADVNSNRIFGPEGFLYALSVNGITTIQQPIELPLVGKAGEFYNGSTWVLSWYSITSTITPYVQFRDDSSDETNNVTVNVGTKTAVETVGSWVRYKAVVTIDADPASTNKCLSVLLDCSGATSIAGVQFEKGGLTTFDHRPIGLELSLCQRYYEVHGNQLDTAQNSSGTSYATWSFKVTKRDDPSTANDSGGIKTGTNKLSATGWQIYGSAIPIRMTADAYVSAEF